MSAVAVISFAVACVAVLLVVIAMRMFVLMTFAVSHIFIVLYFLFLAGKVIVARPQPSCKFGN